VDLPGLGPLIAGGAATWQDLDLSADEVLDLCEAEDLAPLVHQRLMESGVEHAWPPSVRDALAKQALEAAGEELLRGLETRAVIEALAGAGVRALLIKGTPLAYTLYPTPASRPRSDTDLLIAAAQVGTARAVLAGLGFTTTVYCDQLFSQFEVQKIDRFGVTHAFDVHWKVSTQPVFADVLTYGEVSSRAIPVPLLGPSAMTLSLVDALLLACIHPVMHHHNAARLLWLFDIYLLSSRLSRDDRDRFAQLARRRRVAAVCAHLLRSMQTTFNTTVAADIVSTLAPGADAEPSARYLASERRWHSEVISSIRSLPRFGDRVRLLREVLLPSRDYMLGAYRLRSNPLGRWVLPVLYAHRTVRGAWKVLTGKK